MGRGKRAVKKKKSRDAAFCSGVVRCFFVRSTVGVSSHVVVYAWVLFSFHHKESKEATQPKMNDIVSFCRFTISTCVGPGPWEMLVPPPLAKNP